MPIEKAPLYISIMRVSQMPIPAQCGYIRMFQKLAAQYNYNYILFAHSLHLYFFSV